MKQDAGARKESVRVALSWTANSNRVYSGTTDSNVWVLHMKKSRRLLATGTTNLKQAAG